MSREIITIENGMTFVTPEMLRDSYTPVATIDNVLDAANMNLYHDILRINNEEVTQQSLRRKMVEMYYPALREISGYEYMQALQKQASAESLDFVVVTHQLERVF